MSMNPKITLAISSKQIFHLLLAAAFLLSNICCVAAVRGDNAWVDVSQGIGVPVGGLGTGYSAFGKFGFVHVNFDGRPDNVKYDPNTAWGSTYTQDPTIKSTFGFVIVDQNSRYVLQSSPAVWEPSARTFAAVKSYAYLPKGKVTFSGNGSDLVASVISFSPLLPHDLKTATIPIQIFDVTVTNSSPKSKRLLLRLENSATGKAEKNVAVFTDKNGQLAFGVQNGVADETGVEAELDLPSRASQSVRFAIGWYYPVLQIRGDEKRFYSKTFHNASEVVALGLRDAELWSRRIDAWHDSIDVPAYFKRMWFSSLTSVMTSTMLTSKPAYYAIETPHVHLNTMDVDAYTSWINLINWPELERMDMEEFFAVTPLSGPNAGSVPHSLPDDRSNYAVEPIFMVRLYRDYLWFNDPAWASQGFSQAVQAANRVYNMDHYQYLLDSPKGNQSYDKWKMPGVSSYVNSPWIYGLYGLNRLSERLHRSVDVGGVPIQVMSRNGSKDFDSVLWSKPNHDWNCFFRTADASSVNTPDETFTDQLFGRWMLAIDPNAGTVLPQHKVDTALHTLYRNNLVDDSAHGFRGWVNGMLPDHTPDMTAGYHSRTFWYGPQINLGSLLGLEGDEAASLDVFRSVELSMHGDDLAAGEWNKSVNAAGEVIPLPEEPGKDTPRFPPYPRYQSSWEYLPRILGLRMDEQYFYLKPFQTIDFRLTGVQLAGTEFTVRVQSGWTRALLNGHRISLPVQIPRDTRRCNLEFLR